MARRKKGCLGRLLSWIITVAVVAVLLWIGLSVGDYMGLFVKGEYTTKEVLGLKSSIQLKIGGEIEQPKFLENCTWRAVGNKIYIYGENGQRIDLAELQNGVMKIALTDAELEDSPIPLTVPYYRNGKTDREFNDVSRGDKIRRWFAPIENICIKIEDKVQANRAGD